MLGAFLELPLAAGNFARPVDDDRVVLVRRQGDKAKLTGVVLAAVGEVLDALAVLAGLDPDGVAGPGELHCTALEMVFQGEVSRPGLSSAAWACLAST